MNTHSPNTAIAFTEAEIKLAKRLREAGLPWTPMPGQFVLDRSGVVERESPFQEGVYFVLNYEYFMKIAGGEDRFREIMLWLPTWDDCRHALRSLGVSDEGVAAILASTNAFEGGGERLRLYEFLLERVTAQS